MGWSEGSEFNPTWYGKTLSRITNSTSAYHLVATAKYRLAAFVKLFSLTDQKWKFYLRFSLDSFQQVFSVFFLNLRFSDRCQKISKNRTRDSKFWDKRLFTQRWTPNILRKDLRGQSFPFFSSLNRDFWKKKIAR